MSTKAAELPRLTGQLVWCPSDPSLGVGVVTHVEHGIVRVRFLRLREERNYTTRGGESILARYRIGVGERVRDRAGAEHRVKSVEQRPGELTVYELEDGEQKVESELIPEVRDVGAMERLATLNLVHPELVRTRLLGLDLAKLGARPGHAAILGSRAQWLPHQIDVATRAVAMDPVRLLLADEVGLGKTVEAALIYAGLRHEGRANRVLVLTPDALCIQWLGELYRKTHELLVLLDEERVEDVLKELPDLSPFEAHQRIVASIDTVSKDELLADEAVAADWDLVIVDEAHHLRWRREDGGNPAYRLVEGLAAKTRHLLLLTATPMALDPAEYHALLRLLDPAKFDDPASFERTAARVAEIRHAGKLVSELEAEGGAVSTALASELRSVFADDEEDAALVDELAGAKKGSPAQREVAHRTLEALRARHGLAEVVVRNRRGPVGGLPQRRPQVIGLEPSPKQEALIEVGETVMFELAGTIDDPRERSAMLGRLLRSLWAAPRALLDVLKPISRELVQELAPHVQEVVAAPVDRQGLPTGDARLRWLVEQIRALGENEKLLVFVETQVAAASLAAALVQVVSGEIAVFHRGLAPRDQDRQVAWFRDPTGPKVMLSTEAGGEGRNFQFCNKVVLYDLPWRPATIEQRIGRIDRVGQKRDVHVLVPYFKGGYEAAILKVMQDCIGVLDKTVGGIDHQLEFVSDRLAELVLAQSGADEWKALYRETDQLIRASRERIENEVDPILDHASFSPERAAAVLAAVPPNLEERLEEFVVRYADAARVAIRPSTKGLFAIEGAPSAAGGEGSDDGFVATFHRDHALDHEEIEFLSFGHPLVQQALDWAASSSDAAAALAIYRGVDRDGAVFVWRYGIDLPGDVPELAAYFGGETYRLALDEAGTRRPEFEAILEQADRRLDRMDAEPLKQAVARWQGLVQKNHAAAETLANDLVARDCEAARGRIEKALGERARELRRSQARALALVKAKSKAAKELERAHAEQTALLAAEKAKLLGAVEHVAPRLVAVVAVRLMRAKQVSA